MTNQSTIDKLIEMRLTAMADAFRIQMDDPAMKEVPFEDRFGMLVDVEYSNRKNNRLKRLIRQAEFEQPDASIAAIDYHSGRKLNKALINRLATCEYITEYRNIFITGATGSGKTYIGDLPKLYPEKETSKVNGVRTRHSLSEPSVENHIARWQSDRDLGIFKSLTEDIESGRNQYTSIDALKKLYTKMTGKESNVHKVSCN